MGQIGAVVAEVTPTGQYPVSALTGIGQLGSLATAPPATLMAWDEAGLTFHPLGLWLWCYLGMDLLFVAAFSMLGIAILKHRPNTRPARWLLAVTGAACAAEAGMRALTLALARPSATGTGLADLAPTVMARIRQYNDLAMASARRGQPVILVMPVTVYLANSVQPARAVVIPARTPEISVPPSALSTGPATELTGTDALLADIAAETGQGQWMTCAADDLVCANAQATAHAAVPDQLVMVTPTEYPGVAAPLGWLLSQASQKALNRAVRRDVTSPPCLPYLSSKAAQHPYCLPGVGDLADLLALTGPST